MQVKLSYLRFVVKLLLMLLWVTILPMLFLLGKLFGIKQYKKLVPLFHRGCRRILGLQVELSGDVYQSPSTLYVSNHVSYLDIFLLGDLDAYFISKSEVASWPVLGILAKLQNTLFFERKSGRAKQQQVTMQQHLKQGKNLIFFPEGTSTDGSAIQSFKSSLFAAADLGKDQQKTVAIQPVTLAYSHYDGNKMTQAVRDYYAWYADMPFAAHFLAVFKLKKAVIKIHFHPVCYLDQFETRKQCADYCQSVVAKQLAIMLQENFVSGEKNV